MYATMGMVRGASDLMKGGEASGMQCVPWTHNKLIYYEMHLPGPPKPNAKPWRSVEKAGEGRGVEIHDARAACAPYPPLAPPHSLYSVDDMVSWTHPWRVVILKEQGMLELEIIYLSLAMRQVDER
jgi:hypothetical protein